MRKMHQLLSKESLMKSLKLWWIKNRINKYRKLYEYYSLENNCKPSHMWYNRVKKAEAHVALMDYEWLLRHYEIPDK